MSSSKIPPTGMSANLPAEVMHAAKHCLMD